MHGIIAKYGRETGDLLCRIDSISRDFIELIDKCQNGRELAAEALGFLGRQRETCEHCDMRDLVGSKRGHAL